MNNSRIYKSHRSDTATGLRMTLFSILWLAVGLALGAGIALLYAPSSGKRMRRKLTQSLEDGLDSGQDAIEPIVEKLEKEVGDLRHTLEERIAKLR